MKRAPENRRSLLWQALFLCFLLPGGGAGAEATLPQPLQAVGFDQRLGKEIPLDLPFRDEAGQRVRLGEYFGRRPVILVPVYYECPMLCGVVLKDLVASLKVLAFSPGEEFQVVTVSIDPQETPELAARKKETLLARYGRPGTDRGWHLLTGEEGAIQALTRALGFRYAYDPARDEYAHAAGIVILTPEGRIARYLLGVEYPPRDLRLALLEASENRIGSLVDQILLFCFRYDPATGRYSAAVLNLVRLGGVLTVLALGSLMLVLWRRERRQEVEG